MRSRDFCMHHVRMCTLRMEDLHRGPPTQAQLATRPVPTGHEGRGRWRRRDPTSIIIIILFTSSSSHVLILLRTHPLYLLIHQPSIHHGSCSEPHSLPISATAHMGHTAPRPHCTSARISGSLHLGLIAPRAHCISGSLHLGLIVSRAHCISGSLHLGLIASRAHCISGSLHLRE